MYTVHYACMYVYICMAEHVARAAAATVALQDESPAYRLCYPFTCSSLVTTCHCQLIHVHVHITSYRLYVALTGDCLYTVHVHVYSN